MSYNYKVRKRFWYNMIVQKERVTKECKCDGMYFGELQGVFNHLPK
jgi:hypothetical protein